MRRLAVALLVAGLAACGDGDRAERTAPVREAGKRSVPDDALERVRESDLPDDAKRELEEAAELLESAPQLGDIQR